MITVEKGVVFVKKQYIDNTTVLVLIYGRDFEFSFSLCHNFRANIDKSKLLCPTLDIFRYILYILDIFKLT